MAEARTSTDVQIKSPLYNTLSLCTCAGPRAVHLARAVWRCAQSPGIPFYLVILPSDLPSSSFPCLKVEVGRGGGGTAHAHISGAIACVMVLGQNPEPCRLVLQAVLC